MKVEWTNRNVALLGSAADVAIAKRLGLSASMVRKKRLELGIQSTRPKAWTAEEDRLLTSNSDAEVAGALGRTLAAVRERRRQIKRREQARPFTMEEKARLGTCSDSHVARVLRREVSQVRTMREGLGIPKAKAAKEKPWKKGELKLLGKKSDADLGEQLGRSPLAVARKRKQLGIEPILPMKRWTSAEDRLVRTMPDAKAAAATGRTIRAVNARRLLFGIKMMARNRWEKSEVELLGTGTDQAIARKLGRTRAAVALKRISSGIAPAPRRAKSRKASNATKSQVQ